MYGYRVYRAVWGPSGLREASLRSSRPGSEPPAQGSGRKKTKARGTKPKGSRALNGEGGRSGSLVELGARQDPKGRKGRAGTREPKEPIRRKGGKRREVQGEPRSFARTEIHSPELRAKQENFGQRGQGGTRTPKGPKYPKEGTRRRPKGHAPAWREGSKPKGLKAGSTQTRDQGGTTATKGTGVFGARHRKTRLNCARSTKHQGGKGGARPEAA